MSSKIKILPDHVINKIAAGEVVERPASVVKELLENSLDAGATDILVDIEQAGKRLIRITDNGFGMSAEDARTAFERHATSKITSEVELDAIRTMGFRGEALSSIASVSHIRLVTAEAGSHAGVQLEIEAGTIKGTSTIAASQGTVLEVGHLFYNTPARLKFLKSPATEFSHILTAVSRQAMAHPSVRFRLTHNTKTVLDLPSSQNIRERTFQLYGAEIAENVFEFSGGRDEVHIHGLLGRPSYTRGDRTHQDFYINHRAVKNPSLTHALYSAYNDMLMRDRHPVGFLFLELDPSLVDVNVHPTKAEVRFRNQSQIHDLVRDVLREALRNQGMPTRDARHDQGIYEDRVKEALGDYFAGPSSQGLSRPDSIPSTLFGRRRSDALIQSEQPEEQSRQRGLVDGLRSQTTMHAEPELFPLAQIHDSFIIAQSQEGMALIDQHAAHERVLFEKLQDQFEHGNIPVQHLLIPAQLELGPAQGSLLNEYLPQLVAMGFMVEEFGTGTFLIKAVPTLLVGADYKKLLLDVLDEVTVHGKSGKMNELRDELLSVMACHPAIKIHRKLDQREMETLLNSLFQCRMPHTCPHGRPTMIRLSLDELKKMFKRI